MVLSINYVPEESSSLDEHPVSNGNQKRWPRIRRIIWHFERWFTTSINGVTLCWPYLLCVKTTEDIFINMVDFIISFNGVCPSQKFHRKIFSDFTHKVTMLISGEKGQNPIFEWKKGRNKAKIAKIGPKMFFVYFRILVTPSVFISFYIASPIFYKQLHFWVKPRETFRNFWSLFFNFGLHFQIFQSQRIRMINNK